jgi:ornithine--oxo-acid transaminase
LSLNGENVFREGFGPLLPGCTSVPFNDLGALEKALRNKDIAAFIVEPIQGKGVNMPADDYLPEAQKLCQKYGTLFVADEIQTGIGRTGKFWAIEHWGVVPDMICMAKALSGGFIPVGGVAMSAKVMDAVFNRMDRAVVHGSTFSKNNMAMAAGLAALKVIEEERLVENAARQGEKLQAGMKVLIDKYELFQSVRGKGLMIAMEFGSPKSLDHVGNGQQGSFQPDDHHPSFQEPSHSESGRRSRHECRQVPASPGHQRQGQRMDSQRAG